MNESLFSIRNALRMLALILLATMFVVTIKNTVVISKGNEKIQAKQLETLTKLLISQASLSASKMIAQQDQERLLDLTNQLSQDRLAIIKSIPDVEYIEMPNADRCCGMAGTFSIYYYDLAKEIADKKVEAIKSTGADIVVSSCPGCEIQLIDSLLRNKVPVKVMHIMELVE